TAQYAASLFWPPLALSSCFRPARPSSELSSRATSGWGRPLGPVWNESRHADRSRIAPRLRPPTECGGLAGPSGNESRHADRSRIAPRLRPPTECGGLAGPATMIPHSRPTVSVEDAERVARVVRSGHLAQGAEVEAFERELAARLGVAAVAAVSSGSAALELSLRALDVGRGDEVVV